MGQRKKTEKLAKLVSYILERKPDEFGLVPDDGGYVKLKELLKALCEEEGWSHVRRSHIDEILLTLRNPPVEISDNRIRAKNRDRLPKRMPSENPPKILYTCVRRRAHEHVFNKGVSPSEGENVVLSSDLSMAEKIGKRIDRSPVTLTVQVRNAANKGVVFQSFGESLFLSGPIPAECFTGPPLPKEKPETKKQKEPKEKEPPKEPGSYFIDMKDGAKKAYRKKKEIAKDRKKMRDEKRKIWKKHRDGDF